MCFLVYALNLLMILRSVHLWAASPRRSKINVKPWKNFAGEKRSFKHVFIRPKCQDWEAWSKGARFCYSTAAESKFFSICIWMQSTFTFASFRISLCSVWWV